MRTSLIFAVALLFKCYALSVSLPVGRSDDSSVEQDTFSSLLGDEAIDNSLGDTEMAGVTRARGPRMIVIAADANLWRDLRVLHGGLAVHKRKADDNSQAAEHREAGQELGIPILRRDTMRCMVGRVYRPCWEV